ncbi:MAG: sugar transferase [Chloroflexi bacterium]|nr:sugar transferase [Chloroflexota bacterium]
MMHHPQARLLPRYYRWLPILDAILVFLAFQLAYLAVYEWQILRPVQEEFRAPFYGPYFGYYVLLATFLYFVQSGAGLYRSVRGRSWAEEVYRIFSAVTQGTLALMALSFFLQPIVSSRQMLVYVAIASFVLLSLGRVWVRILDARLRARGVGVLRTLLVGVGESGQAVMRTILARKALGYQLVGYLQAGEDAETFDFGSRIPSFGSVADLPRILHEQKIEQVIYTLPLGEGELIRNVVEECRRAGVSFSVVPDFFQLNLRQVQVENLAGIPLLNLEREPSISGRNRLLKRVMDISLLLLTSPLWLLLFLVVWSLTRLQGGGPAIYKQRRVGENGREFFLYKFRSMVADAESQQEQLVASHKLDPRHPKLMDDPRVTRFGRFIRRTSLDELPNVINVLRGQMSLVGPRPPIPKEVALYATWQKSRLQSMPGITGLWQVSGRSEVPFDEMCLLDIYYIENWSLTLDIQILMMTLPLVLSQRGAY